jgi:nucleoredoxin
MKLKLLFLLLFTPAFLFSQEKSIAQELAGSLVQLEGKELKPFDDSRLSETKYFLFYYSAHWCPPCRAFTPQLVDFYKKTKKSHPEFEVVFISNDRSEADMKKYMVELKMPWTAVAFNKIQSLTRINAYAGSGIPCVVVVDAQGKVLADSFKGNQYLGPQKPLDDLKKILK